MSPCPVDKVNLELRSRLLQEINEAEDQERSRKRAKLATEQGAAAITDHFKADTSKETAADLAILEFLVANGISPHVVDHYTFKAMIQQVSKAGPAYKIPRRRDVGVSANRSVSSGEREFGRVLKTGLDLATTAERQGFSRIGLCSQQIFQPVAFFILRRLYL